MGGGLILGGLSIELQEVGQITGGLLSGGRLYLGGSLSNKYFVHRKIG